MTLTCNTQFPGSEHVARVRTTPPSGSLLGRPQAPRDSGADALCVWLTQTRRKETRLPHTRARKAVFQEEKKYPRPLRVLSSRREGSDQNEENVTPGM